MKYRQHRAVLLLLFLLLIQSFPVHSQDDPAYCGSFPPIEKIAWDFSNELVALSTIEGVVIVTSEFEEVTVLDNGLSELPEDLKLGGISALNGLDWHPTEPLFAYVTNTTGGIPALRLVNIQDWTILEELRLPNITVSDLEFSPDGEYIAIAGWIRSDVLGPGSNILIWDIPLNSEENPPIRLPITRQGINAIAWNPEGTHIAAAGDNWLLYIWDVANPEFPKTYEWHESPVNDVRWSSEYLYTIGDFGTLVRWLPESHYPDEILVSHHAASHVIGVSEVSGIVSTGDESGEIIVHFPRSGRILFNNHNTAITGLEWDNEGTRFLSADASGKLCMWEFEQ